MRTRSGAYFSITSSKEVVKSPTREQQIHPEFISLISIPESFKKPPSTPISPNSFSMRTTFVPFKASLKSFLMRVVLPAPRKPDIISILVIIKPPCDLCKLNSPVLGNQVYLPLLHIPLHRTHFRPPIRQRVFRICHRWDNR